MIEFNVLTKENTSLIASKAKEKTDGIYSFRGISYIVKNKSVCFYVLNGEILMPCGHFNLLVGNYERDSDKKRLLKELFNTNSA